MDRLLDGIVTVVEAEGTAMGGGARIAAEAEIVAHTTVREGPIAPRAVTSPA